MEGGGGGGGGGYMCISLVFRENPNKCLVWGHELVSTLPYGLTRAVCETLGYNCLSVSNEMLGTQKVPQIQLV